MQETRTILVPVDFSSHSRAAALRACDLAQASGASVRLIHALDLPAIAAREGLASHLWDELRLSEQCKLDELLADLAHRDVPLSAIVKERDPVDLIAESAACKDVELIVMGTHGYRGFDRMFLGSVAERTILTTTVPVMTVKENEWDAASRIRRILLATDFSADSKAAVEFTIRWAQILDADVEVIHAIKEVRPGPTPNGFGGTSSPGAGQRQEALDGLRGILSRMSEAGVSAGADLAHGPAAIEIAKRAKESRANLIVMGRRGVSRIEHALFGSVVTSVLKQVRCSVSLVPGTEAKDGFS
jgi:nucleotide-binding universal stress UspA family protein